MTITLDFPAAIEERLREEVPNLDAEAKIAVALDLFRKELITIHDLRRMLGMKWDEVNRFLIERQEWSQSPTLEDLESDYQTLVELHARKRT
jgi:predicted HTH domain antitoxin